MVVKFKQFVADPALLNERATNGWGAPMKASGNDSIRHVEKYLNDTAIQQHVYKMAKSYTQAKELKSYETRKPFMKKSYEVKHPTPIIRQGEEVRVNKVFHDPQTDKIHAEIQHPAGNAVVPINYLHKPPIGRAGRAPEQQEDVAISHLHNQIQQAVAANGGNPITIRHNGEMYNVSGARKVVKGDYSGSMKPKGDIILHHEGTPQIFLSHKTKHFAQSTQNYEGLSKHIGNEQVNEFLNDLKAKHPEGLKAGLSYTRKFSADSESGKKLQRAVMFGSLHDSDEHGVHNVHSIEHGMVNLRQHPAGHYEIVSEKSIPNNKSFDPSEHPLEFTARFATGRNDQGIRNARIGIAKAGSRPFSMEL